MTINFFNANCQLTLSSHLESRQQLTNNTYTVSCFSRFHIKNAFEDPAERAQKYRLPNDVFFLITCHKALPKSQSQLLFCERPGHWSTRCYIRLFPYFLDFSGEMIFYSQFPAKKIMTFPENL